MIVIAASSASIASSVFGLLVVLLLVAALYVFGSRRVHRTMAATEASENAATAAWVAGLVRDRKELGPVLGVYENVSEDVFASFSIR